MTKVFDEYSDYYDLLYQDKDYASEAYYINGLIRKHAPEARSVLDLGCGTGNHDLLLVQKGYSITGVDLSVRNIHKARSKLHRRDSEIDPSALDFIEGDIRTIRVDCRFDVVISLFHVMSYQNTNRDLKRAFKTAKAHLKPGGLFVFDCWYGPAVLTHRPEVRVKRAENELFRILRLAEPEMLPNENLVKVRYELWCEEKATGRRSEIREVHSMRYLFKPEVEDMLLETGFGPSSCVEWMTEASPGFDSWSVCFIQTG